MIIIVGAGMAGVTLARSLKRSGVPFRIFDQQPGWKPQGYGLTLRGTTTNQLCEMLDLVERDFRAMVAVDRKAGLMNTFLVQVTSGHRLGAASFKEGYAVRDFRTNRERLRATIMGDVEVEYGHRLVGFRRLPGDEGVQVDFANGVSVTGDYLIAADGVHSLIRRTLVPECVPRDFEGTMINGLDRLSARDFDERLRPVMRDSCVYIGVGDNCILAVLINDVDPADGAVHISWGYSRRVRHAGPEADPLFVPYSRDFDKGRSNPQLWREIAALPRPMVEPFRFQFDRLAERGSQTIHHQLVKLLIPRERLSEVLAAEKVVFIGDSVHDWSNHAGTAANTAIQDAMALGDMLAAKKGLEELYDLRYPEWLSLYEANGQDFEALHRPKGEWDKMYAEQENQRERPAQRL